MIASVPLLVALVAAPPAGSAGGVELLATRRGRASAERRAAMDLAEIGARPLTLDDCLAIALERNIALRIQESELRRARAAHSASFAKFLPTLDVGATREESDSRSVSADILSEATVSRRGFNGGVAQEFPTGAQLSFTRALGPDLIPRSHGTSRSYIASVTQPLLRGAGTGVSLSGIRGTGYALRARSLDLDNARRETALAVKLAYYGVLRDRELILVNASALEADSLLVQASNAMVEAKIATRRDVLSAQIRLSDDAANVVVAERDYQLSLDQLRDVLGLPFDIAIAVADTGLAETPVTLDEQALIRSALQSNPAIQSAEYAVKLSRVDLDVARNGRLPQLDLLASYTETHDSAPDALLDSRAHGWVASVNLRYPLFQREATALAVQARAVLSQQQDRLALLQREVTLRVRDVVRSVYSTAEEIRAISQTIDSAGEKVRFATAMFNMGRASNLDITDARESLLKGRTQYVRKLADYHGQLALLESLTGERFGR